MSQESISDVRWGGALLDAVSVNASRGRALIAQMPARGQGGALLDRGPELREWRVAVRWTSCGRGDDPARRRQRLLELPCARALPAKMSIEQHDEESGQTDRGVEETQEGGLSCREVESLVSAWVELRPGSR